MTEISATEPSNTLDTLLDEGSEKLVWVTPKAPLSFRFNWEKILFSAKLDRYQEGHRLILLGDMGPLPFTAERPNYRERLLQLLAWKAEGERIRFVLEPTRHHIYLMIDDILGQDVSGINLVTSAISSLLHARPFIELAREVGWQHPIDTTPKDFNVAPAGTAPDPSSAPKE